MRLNPCNKLHNYLSPILVFLLSSVVYIHHLSPSIYGYDSGDFATAIIAKGVPHASGYPLYIILGIILNLLPINQTPAWKIGLISAFASSFSVLLIYLIIYGWLKNKLIAIIGSLYIAFLYTFWSYAEVVEVFALNSFFVLLLLFLALSYDKKKKTSYLLLLSFSLGLSLTNNEVILLFFPAIGIILLKNWRSLSLYKIIYSILFFLLGLLPYLYIPIAASFKPAVNTENASNLKNFIHLVLRQGYGWGVTSKLPLNFSMLWEYSTLLINEVGWYAIIIIIFGIIYLVYKKKILILLVLLTGFILTGPFYFIYTRITISNFFLVGVIERFFITSSILLSLFLPFGIFAISQGLNKLIIVIVHKSTGLNQKTSYRKNYTFLILAIFFLIPYNSFSAHYNSTDLHNIWIGDNLGKDIIMNLPKNSLILPFHDTIQFNTKYIQFAQNIRRDVFIPSAVSGINDFYYPDNMVFNELKSVNKKYKNLDMATLITITFYSLRNEKPLFTLNPIPYNKKIFNKTVILVPYGLLFKIADDYDLKMTAKEFDNRQKKLLQNTQINEFLTNEKYSELANTNFNFISIKEIYYRAYMVTASFLADHYKDKKRADYYINKVKNL